MRQDLETRLHDVWINAYHAGLNIVKSTETQMIEMQKIAFKHAEDAIAAYQNVFSSPKKGA